VKTSAERKREPIGSRNSKVVPVHAKKDIKCVTIYLHSFLTSALDGVSGQPHATAAVRKGIEIPVHIEYGDYVGPKAVLDVIPFQESNPGSFSS
jgi:hypothetical protein